MNSLFIFATRDVVKNLSLPLRNLHCSTLAPPPPPPAPPSHRSRCTSFGRVRAEALWPASVAFCCSLLMLFSHETSENKLQIFSMSPHPCQISAHFNFSRFINRSIHKMSEKNKSSSMHNFSTLCHFSLCRFNVVTIKRNMQ